MTGRKHLKMLRRLADTNYATVQKEFTALTQNEARLIGTLKQLDDTRTVRDARTDVADTAYIAGADLRWQRWADVKRGAINTELAQLRAQKLQLRGRLQRAFGKTRVLNELMKQHAVQDTQARSRRND